MSGIIEGERECSRCGHPFWAQKKVGDDHPGRPWYYCIDCRTDIRKKHQISYSERIRFKALQHISDVVKCTICSEDDLDVLQIDHIHNDGKEDQARYGGNKFYLHIIRSPQEYVRTKYQILCANCNVRKERVRRRLR